MDELELMRVRDEVLPALYWMTAEGIAESPRRAQLARFLAVSEQELGPWLDALTGRGWLDTRDDGYRLTPAGEDLGRRAFADDFADMTGATHGECDENCWCHSSPDEARRCLDERVHHVH